MAGERPRVVVAEGAVPPGWSRVTVAGERPRPVAGGARVETETPGDFPRVTGVLAREPARPVAAADTAGDRPRLA